MKRNHRVAALFPLMLLVSMVGFGGYETHTNESTHVIVEVVEAAFGATPLMAQNGEGTCRSCKEQIVGNYRHMFESGGSCGGNGPDAVQQGGLDGFCRECEGELVEECEGGHECCHTNWTEWSENLSCDSHSPCSPGGGPDPDFSPLELAHRIDRMVIRLTQASGPEEVEMAARTLARFLIAESAVSFAASTEAIELYGCRDASLPAMLWLVPPHIRDAVIEPHRVALRDG